MKLSRELMAFIKKRATSQGVSQKSIAEYFDVSIPTVKRWYAGKGISLEQASDICTYLGLSLGQALASIENIRDTFEYSNSQEKFFANNPDYLAFFDNLLRGKKPFQVAKKFNLSESKVTNYLLKLDKLGLIELHPGNKAKILVQGEPVWSKDGPLAKELRGEILDSFLAIGPKNKIEKFHLIDLSEQDFNELNSRILDLSQFITRANGRAAYKLEGQTKSYGFYIALNEFRWSLDTFLK